MGILDDLERDNIAKGFVPKAPPPQAPLASPTARQGGDVFDRARAYVATMDPAVSGQHGHDQTFKVAQSLAVGFGLSDADALTILREWNQTCQPPWKDPDLVRKVEQARTESRLPPGYLRDQPLANRAEPLPSRSKKAPGTASEPRMYCSQRDAGLREVFLRLPSGEWLHVALARLHKAIRDYKVPGIKIERTDKKGKVHIVSATAIVDEHARFYRRLAYDYRAQGVSFEPETETLRVGIKTPKIEAQRDSEVDAWLRALAGDQYDRLMVFIASCAQRHMGRTAATLVLLGRASIGKSLFSKALSGLWGRGRPTAAKELIAQFNGSLKDCPIIADEECQVFGTKELSTSAFRDLSQETERMIEHKGKEKVELHGAFRIVVLGNELSDLKFRDLRGPEVVNALTERLLLIHCEHPGDAIEALTRLNVPGEGSHRIDVARITRHFAWICEHVTMPDERFVGAGGSSEAALLMSHVEDPAYQVVFQEIASVLSIAPQEVTKHSDVWRDLDSVWIRTAQLASTLHVPGSTITRAIRPFLTGQEHAWTPMGSVRAKALGAGLLRQALNIPESEACHTYGEQSDLLS